VNTTTASSARLAANQANAQRSTGPRTQEGKAAASQNARKHGLACSDETLARTYSAEYQALVSNYLFVFEPQDQVMTDLVHEMTSARLRLDRVTQLETIALQNEPTLDQLVTLQKLERYRKSAEASYHRALKKLCQLSRQPAATERTTMRPTSPNEPTTSSAQPLHYQQPKPGRNDRCPCGSNRKYKQCCLGTPSDPARLVPAA